MDFAAAYETLFTVTLYILAACLLCALLRAVLGPRVADRIVAVNMIGTDVILSIAILSFLQKEDYLADIGFIYAMLSFLTVVMLSKIYTGVYRKYRHTVAGGQTAQAQKEGSAKKEDRHDR